MTGLPTAVYWKKSSDNCLFDFVKTAIDVLKIIRISNDAFSNWMKEKRKFVFYFKPNGWMTTFVFFKFTLIENFEKYSKALWYDAWLVKLKQQITCVFGEHLSLGDFCW